MQMTLPAYERDRSRWRERILTRALEVATDTAVSYADGDKLEVVLLLYLREGKRLTIHDVDNRLKDVLDALQGRCKQTRRARRLLSDDRQVRRVVVEKQKIPKSVPETVGGRLLIRPYVPHRWPLQQTKGLPRLRKRRS